MSENAHSDSGRRQSAQRTIAADHHQYLVVIDGEPFPEPGESEPSNGLVDRLSGQLTIFSGRQDGPVRVELEYWGAAPQLDLVDWDDVVEVGLSTSEGDVRLGGLLSGVPSRMPNLVRDGPGAYRLRVSVRGRDAAAAQTGRELHRLQLWSAVGPVEIRHQLTDIVGAELRGETSSPILDQRDQLAVAAMDELVAVLSNTGRSDDVGTIDARIDITATRGKVYRELIDLGPLMGYGGSSPDWVGQHSFVFLHRGTATQPTLQLWHRWEVADRPASSSWSTRWLWSGPTEATPLPEPANRREPGDASLTVRLDWHRPYTTVTASHAQVPVEQLPALTVLWDYWLYRLKTRCEAGRYPPLPWDMM